MNKNNASKLFGAFRLQVKTNLFLHKGLVRLLHPDQSSLIFGLGNLRVQLFNPGSEISFGEEVWITLKLEGIATFLIGKLFSP